MEIVKQKIQDMNTDNVDAAIATITGSARSMGVEIVD
jgi:large subunit ribosomal protein L11